MAKTSTGGRLKAAIFLLVSMFAAALASLVIFTVIRNFQTQLAEAQAPKEYKTIIVAKRTLWPGETLKEEDLDIKEFPPDFIPAEALTVKEEAINRVPRERILSQEFIRKERLALREAGRGLNAIVPRGMRAVSLDISGGSAVSGFLNPGNYVDILVTIGEKGGPLQTVTMLQAVTVLAVNDRLGAKQVTKEKAKGGSKASGRRSKPSVTVAVTPDQAEKITYAHTQGEVTLTLRNDIDVTSVETHGAMNTNLIGTDGPEGTRITVKEYQERLAKQQDGTLIIIKGSKKTEDSVTLP
ncbi:MAG: Flp pilus assembly protein CpaB [Alphaproteobacteria bacterium]|nr:Flp pilus assembly protein CpaB [Alphaproteobacteria bacterium]